MIAHATDHPDTAHLSHGHKGSNPAPGACSFSVVIQFCNALLLKELQTCVVVTETASVV
jgi:hypothetical protein